LIKDAPTLAVNHWSAGHPMWLLNVALERELSILHFLRQIAGGQTVSSTNAVPCPTPTHIEHRARWPPVRFSW
jgi:hypothetical protein